MRDEFFQAGLLVKRDYPTDEAQIYTYKNCSICMSVDHHEKENSADPLNVVFPDIVVSIVPHFGKGLSERELDGLLRYLGLDTSAPMKRSTVRHKGVPGMGDTEYYIQQMPMPILLKSFRREYKEYCKSTGRKNDGRFEAWLSAPSARTRILAQKLRAAM